MPLVLNGATSGSTTIQATDAVTTTITLPPNNTTLAGLTTPSFTTTIGVGGATASASGSGITFPATQSASSDANTLDDYEEGTFTPTFTNMGTVTLSYAYYTKIGNVCTCWVSFSASSAPTANSSLFTLPFTSAAFGGGTWSKSTTQGGVLEPQNGNTNCYFATTSSAAGSGFICMVVFRTA